MLLDHGQQIDIGGTVVRCHHTPGHTPGTMSDSFDVTVDGKKQTAFLMGGPGLQTLRWANNGYPGAPEERRRQQIEDFTRRVPATFQAVNGCVGRTSEMPPEENDYWTKTVYWPG